MGKLGKGRRQISVNVSAAVADEIEARAKPLHDMKPSRFAALILEKWLEDGAAPISEPDKLLLIAKKGGGRKAG